MKRALAALTISTLSAMPVFAQPSGLQGDLDAMVAAERAFSKLSKEKGAREAFLHYITDDGILFRFGAAVKGKPWTAENGNPPFDLTWRPVHAEIARSGDFGWSTGPYELRPAGTEEVHHGRFLRVWRKQPDGQWRFVIDSGIHTGKPPAPETGTPAPVAPGKFEGEVRKADPEAGKQALLAADRELGQAAGKGTAAALSARLAEDAHVMRNGSLPFIGAEAFRPALRKDPAEMTSQPTDGGVSGAGDMGYTYGTAEWKEGGQTVKANYTRVWEKRDGDWKLRIDCLNPIPPPQE